MESNDGNGRRSTGSGMLSSRQATLELEMMTDRCDNLCVEFFVGNS